ncbi:MAG: hypothetical protein GTO21_10070 [Armatimonadetes bacterium]|nr:hypothetical protein [Armatimonadota bacterium]
MIVLLVVAMLAIVGLRILATNEKRIITHDEGISYLSATGHQGEYSAIAKGHYPFGAWVRASEWKRLIRVEKPFCLKQIGSDLAHFDIHPPLFFWVLHLWSLIWGVTLWTGPSLNTAIALLTALTLFGFARYALGNSWQALAVACVWGFSPVVIQISLEARQYDLLALWTVLFIWQILKCSDLRRQFSWREYTVLIAVVAAGALTQYLFSLAVAGALLFLVARLAWKDARRLAKGVLSIGVGYVIFYLLHPGFYLAFARQRAQENPGIFEDVGAKIETVCKGFLDFFTPATSARPLPILIALAAVMIIWILLVVPRRDLRSIFQFDSANSQSVYFFSWILGSMVLFYFAFMSPSPGMGGRYMAMVWPFFAFTLIFILGLSAKYGRILMGAFCIAMLASGISSVLGGTSQDLRPDSRFAVELSDKTLVDNVSRGVLPRVFWHIADDSYVFAASQEYLLDHKDLWLPYLDGAVYISSVHYGGTFSRQRQLLALISKDYKICPDEKVDASIGRAFIILDSPAD